MIRFLAVSALMLVAALPLPASRLRQATASLGRLREASASLAGAPPAYARTAMGRSPMVEGGGAEAGGAGCSTS